MPPLGHGLRPRRREETTVRGWTGDAAVQATRAVRIERISFIVNERIYFFLRREVVERRGSQGGTWEGKGLSL